MKILALQYGDPLWEKTADFAENCTWEAGPALAKNMRENAFTDWERVIVALDDDESVIGYCTLTKTDCLPDAPYTPYIGFLYVAERYRGQRIGGRLIDHAAELAAEAGFDRVFLVSRHVGLYEKYGFAAIDSRPSPKNRLRTETIFMRECTDSGEPAPDRGKSVKNMAQLLFYIVLLIGMWVVLGKIAFPS